MAQIPVSISYVGSHPPTCFPDRLRLSKRNHDHILWSCLQDPNWKVTMQDPSPFKDKVFTAANPDSGEPILTPDPGTCLYFKYAVEAGGLTTDPGVIIDP
jgi:hypothetical protein